MTTVIVLINAVTQEQLDEYIASMRSQYLRFLLPNGNKAEDCYCVDIRHVYDTERYIINKNVKLTLADLASLVKQ